MASEYKYNGEIFLVDNSKGCYLEVSYKDVFGYVGVWVNGTCLTVHTRGAQTGVQLLPKD